MPFLILNVFLHRGHIGCAHAEGGIAFLPRKSLAHPFGGIGFENIDRLGERQRGRQLKENVDVVFHSPDFMHQDAVLLTSG